MNNDPKRVKEIFLEAADLSDEAARAAYLDKACGSDAGLRSRVETLLRAHDPEGSFLGTPAAAVPDADHAATCDLAPAPNHAAAPTSDGGAGASDDEPLTFLAPPTRPDALGRLGHFEVLQVLGRGGFGIVFRAFDEMLQRVVALKVMAPQLAAMSPARKRFLREARSSAQVRHENVVQVYEVAEQPLPYLVMEFIPGETLQQKLDRVGPLEVPEVLRIGRQIAEGLAAAHATDLIHRDIKPGNVLLESGQHKVKITDFGLARTADDASISQSGIIAGTPMYMAPEQALGQTLDQQADLFSLGSVLYQMVTGRPPFRASTPVAVLKRVAEDKPRAIREIIPETPPWLCDIIAKLHAKNPDDRYQSARAVADVLADCEAQLKANARLKDYSRIPRSKPRRSGRRKWAAAAAVLLPVIALTVTESAGLTYLFHGRRITKDSNLSESGPKTEASKQETTHADGWVQLFNGKDLTGWKPAPGLPGEWQVVNGEIVCKDADATMLCSERGDYENFRVRAEVQSNDGGDCGLWFRACSDKFVGYQAFIFCSAAEQPPRTGSLYWWHEGHSDGLIIKTKSTVPADTWFRIEVIARGSEITVLVNGKIMGVTRDERSLCGHIAFSTFRKHSALRVRSIEIKELPPPPSIAPFSDADVRRIAALPAAEQVEEVCRELMRRNPGFDGKAEHNIEDGVVTEFRIVTDRVTDIAPIRVFNGLRVLQCNGTHTAKPNGLLADLTPLEGMNLANLTHLDLKNTKVSDAGMAFFKDCKNLMHLDLELTQVSDAGLAYFKDCKNLTILVLRGTQVSDVGMAFFKDCKDLTHLFLTGPVSDAGLAYFKDCRNLMDLRLAAPQVGDGGLAHFKDCKNLGILILPGTQVGDAGLVHLKDCKSLTDLWLQGSKVSGLAPLKDMRLEVIRLTLQNITPQGMDILRAMKSLKTIGISHNQVWPAAEFWDRYDKGEFKE